jgi:hypothetical protein
LTPFLENFFEGRFIFIPLRPIKVPSLMEIVKDVRADFLLGNGIENVVRGVRNRNRHETN